MSTKETNQDHTTEETSHDPAMPLTDHLTELRKRLIIIAAFQAGLHGIAGVTILVSFVTLVSFLKVLRYAFLGELPETLKSIKESPALMGISLVILAILCTGMGLLLLPSIREIVLEPAVAAISGGVEYAKTVLANY